MVEASYMIDVTISQPTPHLLLLRLILIMCSRERKLYMLLGLSEEELMREYTNLHPFISEWSDKEAGKFFDEEFLNHPELDKKNLFVIGSMQAKFDCARRCACEVFVLLFCKFKGTRILEEPSFKEIVLKSLFAFYFTAKMMEEKQMIFPLPQTVTAVTENFGLRLRNTKDYRKELTTKCLEGGYIYTILHATTLFEDVLTQVNCWKDFTRVYPVFDDAQDRKVREACYFNELEEGTLLPVWKQKIHDRFYRSLDQDEKELLWRTSNFMAIVVSLSENKQVFTLPSMYTL